MAEQVRTEAKTRLIVCCGPGGVGKTTVAAAIAMRACDSGLRAVVVTVDPARRLADSMGLSLLDNEPKIVRQSESGVLSALMLDPKATFDELIRNHSRDETQAERILSNRLYQNLSSTLGGTQEYMAMEKLHLLWASGDYELIVIDTPPSRNAVDLLDAPNRISRFLSNRVIRALMLPAGAYLKVVGVATKALLRLVSKTIGAEVLEDVFALFSSFEGMEQGFAQRARQIRDLLQSPQTDFVLVSSGRADAVEEAIYFAEHLQSSEFALRFLVLNRIAPKVVDSKTGPRQSKAISAAVSFLGQMREADMVGAERIRSQLGDVEVIEVPLSPNSISDLDALAFVGSYLSSISG